MTDVPKFRLYGEGNPIVEGHIQPALELREWCDLETNEKQTALQELANRKLVDEYSTPILRTVDYLNNKFLRLCPGKRLHKISPNRGNLDSIEYKAKAAALQDFSEIFVHETSNEIVLRMISKFLECHIDSSYYRMATESTEDDERSRYIEIAFGDFDRLANCLNHIFEQFAVNQLATRVGLVPRQDDAITKELYLPTLAVLSDPKWSSVNEDITAMFDDFRKENFPETITKAHRAVQRFLQILVGEEGRSAKGEVGKLFAKAKKEGVIPVNRYTEAVINGLQSFIVSERATRSTAKPGADDATSSDALLLMNAVMVLFQYSLQNIGGPKA